MIVEQHDRRLKITRYNCPEAYSKRRRLHYLQVRVLLPASQHKY